MPRTTCLQHVDRSKGKVGNAHAPLFPFLGRDFVLTYQFKVIEQLKSKAVGKTRHGLRSRCSKTAQNGNHGVVKPRSLVGDEFGKCLVAALRLPCGYVIDFLNLNSLLCGRSKQSFFGLEHR
jgi:hypothetical protein